MGQQDKTNFPFFRENPWDSHPNSIWLGSTLTLLRNVEKFNFPAKLATDKRKQILSLLSKGILNSDQLKKPKLVAAEEVSPVEKEFLMEHFLPQQSFQQAYTGEAFIWDETGKFLALLNLKDHLLLEWIDTREELELSWDRLVKIELELNKNVNFAFSPKFGFLTADPTLCGSGFIVTIFLHLPALLYTHRLEELINKHKEDCIEQIGLQGDPSEMIGDIFAFRNRLTLGVTEEAILATLRTLATKLLLEEKSVRQYLKKENENKVAEVKDKVSRAYAILMHSYQIEAIEALQALSLVKLGLDLEWLKGISQSVLNQLLFACRRAHLICNNEQKISQEELPHKRAEFIHKTLHGLELLIS